MSARALRRLGLGLSACSGLLIVGAGILFAANGSRWDGDAVGFAPILVSTLVAGTLLVARRPDHRVSWLLAGGAFALATLSFADEYTTYGWRTAPGSLPAMRIVSYFAGGGFFGVLLLLGCLLPLTFPTGHPPSRRWRLVGWTGALGYLLLVFPAAYVAATEDPERLIGGEGVSTGIAVLDFATAAGITLMLLATLAALVSLIVRYRRSRGIERKQGQWFLWAASLMVMGVVTELVQQGVVSGVLLTLGVVALPVSITAAILRYRLYDIDRLIFRTFTYAIVVVLLAAVYVGAVFVVGSLLPFQGDVAVASSTLAAAALFSPLRRRVQSWVDRRFNRARYNAQRVVESFGQRLRSNVDLESVQADLTAVVADTVQPAAAGVWLRETR